MASAVSISSKGPEEVPKTTTHNSVFDLPPYDKQLKSEVIDETQINQHDSLFFKPSELHFSEQPMCIFQERRVRLYNTGDNSVRITSLSTDSQDFHATIVKPNSISEQSSSTSSSSSTVSWPADQKFLEISISFLPRRVGTAQARIVVQTELGPLVYHVKGRGRENNYHIKPIFKHQLPLGVDYRRLIVLHNPHSKPLKIDNIHSNESFLRITPAEILEVAPHQKQSVGSINVRPSKKGKYQGIIYIDTNYDDLAIQTELLVVEKGVHPTSDDLEFGVLTYKNETRKREIELLNSGNTGVRIFDIYLSNQSKDISYSLITQSDDKNPSKGPFVPTGGVNVVAQVQFTASEDGLYEGTIILRTNESARIEIPYRARVIKGSLEYSQEITSFLIGHSVPRPFKIFNRFSQPVQFSLVSLLGEDASLFKIENFQPGTVIWPATYNEDISVQLKDAMPANQTECAASILVRTNITDFYIPLTCFDGTLSIGFVELDTSITLVSNTHKQQIDLGLIQPGSRIKHQLWVENHNPISMGLTSWHSTVDAATLTLVGVTSPEDNAIVPFSSSDTLELQSHQKAIFHLDLRTLQHEDVEENGLLQFNTTYGITTAIPLHYASMAGSISLLNDSLDFGESFPGKIVSCPLIAINNYNRSIGVTNVKASDSRFIPELTVKAIPANTESTIGVLHFDPSRSPDIQTFEDLSFGGPEFISTHELENWTEQRKVYSKLKKKVAAKVVINTDFFSSMSLSAYGQLTEPSIVAEKEIVYERTHVGNSVNKYIRVVNPSNRPIQAQILSISDLTAAIRDPLLSTLRLNASLDHKDTSSQSNKHFSWKSGFDHERDPFIVSQDQHISIIKPYSEGCLGPVIFTPSSVQPKESIILIKNNLTVLEPVHVKGYGGHGNIQFYSSNSSRNPLSKLNFETSTKEYPAHEQSAGIDQEMVFIRNYTVRNTGDVDVKVEKGAIGGIGCSAFGVTLRQCGPMTIKANSSVQITLEFKPDFSTTHMQLQLKFYTNIGKVSIPLSITMPPHFLHHYYGRDTHFTSNTSLRYLLLVVVLLGLLYLIYMVWSDFRLGVSVVIGYGPKRTKRKFDSEAPSDEEWSPETQSSSMLDSQQQQQHQYDSSDKTFETNGENISVYTNKDYQLSEKKSSKKDVDIKSQTSHIDNKVDHEKKKSDEEITSSVDSTLSKTSNQDNAKDKKVTKNQAKKDEFSHSNKNQINSHQKHVQKTNNSKNVQRPSSPQKQTKNGSKSKKKRKSADLTIDVKRSSSPSAHAVAKTKESDTHSSNSSSNRNSSKKSQQQHFKSNNSNTKMATTNSKVQHGSTSKKYKNRQTTTTTTTTSSSSSYKNNGYSRSNKAHSEGTKIYVQKQYRRRHSISDSQPPSLSSSKPSSTDTATTSTSTSPSNEKDKDESHERTPSSLAVGSERQVTKPSSSLISNKRNSAPSSPQQQYKLISNYNHSNKTKGELGEERLRATSDPMSYVDENSESQAQQEIFKILNANRPVTAPPTEINRTQSPSTETQGYWQNFPVSSSSSSSLSTSSSTTPHLDASTPSYKFEDIYSRLSDALHPNYHYPINNSNINNTTNSNGGYDQSLSAHQQQNQYSSSTKKKGKKQKSKDNNDKNKRNSKNKKKLQQHHQPQPQQQQQQHHHQPQQQQQQQQQYHSMVNNQFSSNQSRSYSLFSDSHPYGSASSLFGGFSGVPNPHPYSPPTMSHNGASRTDYQQYFYQQNQQSHQPYYHIPQQHHSYAPSSFRNNPPFIPIRMHPPQEEDSFFSQSPTSFTLAARRNQHQSQSRYSEPIPFNLNQVTSLFPEMDGRGSPSSNMVDENNKCDDNVGDQHHQMNHHQYYHWVKKNDKHESNSRSSTPNSE